VRAFDVTPWIPGAPPEIRGEGIGQVRIFDRPNGKIFERLTSLDEGARTLTYTIPEGMPFPVSTYEATMTVSDDVGRARLTWSCVFEPDGASADEIAAGIQNAFGAMMSRIEAYLTKA
jgi:hypothetical protein